MDSALEAIRSLLKPPEDKDQDFEAEGKAQGAALSIAAAIGIVASHAQMLESLACELLSHPDKEQHVTLSRGQLQVVSDGLRTRLGLPRLSDVQLYLAVAACDRDGSNRLDSKDLATFLGDQLCECARALDARESLPMTAQHTPRRLCQHPRAPPPSPTEALTVTLRTLAGHSCQATLSSSATTEELKLAVSRSPLGIGHGQHLLAAEGCLLADGMGLQEQGVTSGSIIDVVCATPAPELVRLECKGLGCGPSIRGSCGTFRRAETSRLKNGRPIYIRDSSLSNWNLAMKYHGDGPRYLVYEEHQLQGKRWALTDDKDWIGYADRCYAFVSSDAYHPGYLEGRLWCIYRDAKYQGGRVWVEHESLSLTVESDRD